MTPPRGSTDPLQWRDLFQAAVLELDPDKLPLRISIAQEVVMNAIEDALHAGAGSDQQTLLDALNTLRDLRAMTERRIVGRDPSTMDGNRRTGS